jgi:hypothetical protein
MRAKLSFEKALGVIIIALSIASVIFIAVQTARLGDVTECQASYNEAYTKAIQERANAARDERHAQRTLWTTFLNAQIPVEEKRAALVHYLKTLDEADHVRETAKLPTRRC